ncbi:DEAD/DEAH box helicase family protein [Vreelandella rituensis]|uniref:Helicase n=1 Tax=Vreelandella rituensis TaxID=2282306 RepID=A0A368U4U6_9GAMM|nr:DEAD/DEAH box helicase family protein [Halomonas rituensis]RCV92170.1 helicase [Halomonas rituensis]
MSPSSSHGVDNPNATVPPLRQWQSDCLARALANLTPQSPHFLCQATPGAGKMLLAAVLAQALITRDAIDYVVYLGPTRAVVKDARDTLGEVLNSPLDGQLGAIGVALTYHALANRLAALKHLCRNFRVLLIWDESHHASAPGGQINDANQWGLALMALERHVRYTLALSGTPWRTDGSCLPLLRYVEATLPSSDEDDITQTRPSQQRLTPDYVYTLKDALQDGICRHPHVELVDNRSIGLTRFHPRTGRKEARQYSSIPHLLRHPAVHYADVIRDEAPLQHVLSLGIARLSALRQQDPNAGGLVVAADILHAEEIAQRLEDAQQSVCLVTSNDPTAHAQLEAFRDAETSWIVAVGMVSEGVNLPRLRVCCYLSHVRTEQFFRQVLGRIIRRRGAEDGTCYFYALNETFLRRFARRLNDDLPDDLANVTPVGNTARAADDTSQVKAASDQGVSAADQTETPISSSATNNAVAENAGVALTFQEAHHGAVANTEADVAFSQAFFERLVALRLTY